MASLSNINLITFKGKRIEFFENNDDWKTSTNDPKKTILSRYVIEQMIQSATTDATNNFLAPCQDWTIETNDGVLPSILVYEFLDIQFLDTATIFKDVVIPSNGLNSFSRTTETATNSAIVKILNGYDYSHVCIPKFIKLVDKIDSTKNKTYEVKAVVFSSSSSCETIIAPTVEYFTTSTNTLTEIGETLIFPTKPTTEGEEVVKTIKILSKSLILFKSTIDFNLCVEVEDFVDTVCVSSDKKLKLEILKCGILCPVGVGFKEIVLNSNLTYLKDYLVNTTRTDLFQRDKTTITIPQNFVCSDSILDISNIQKQDFEKLIIIDIEYLQRTKANTLTKPVDRYTLWNLEERQMDLFYRHKNNVSNDILFKRNNEMYDQTYKLLLIPDNATNPTKFYYNSTVESNLPIYYFASTLYDEDYKPYELSENNVETSAPNVITIKGNREFKIEVSEKFNNIQFRFDSDVSNYIIRYSMPHLNTEILNTQNIGTLFLNDGTTFIEAGMDDPDDGIGNWGLMPTTPNRITIQCQTICKTIYLGVEFFNSEILESSTTSFRYGKYIHPTDTTKGCFKEIYMPIECIENDPNNPSKTEEERVKIVKNVMFGNESFGGSEIVVHFYRDDNIETITRNLKLTAQQNVFGRKFYVIDK